MANNGDISRTARAKVSKIQYEQKQGRFPVAKPIGAAEAPAPLIPKKKSTPPAGADTNKLARQARKTAAQAAAEE